jgi:hypothetical protein
MPFLFKLETTDGEPAEPWDVQNRSPELAGRRHDPVRSQNVGVVGVKDEDADQPPVLVVEDVSARA